MNNDIQTLEEKLSRSSTPLAKIKVMNKLAYELQYYDLTRANQIANEAEQLAINNESDKSVEYAYTLCNLGYFNLRKGQIDTAINELFTALQIFQQENDLAGCAKVSGIIGLTFAQIGNFTEAIKYQLKQLEISQEQQLTHEESLAYNGLGIIQNNTDNHVEALAAHQKSASIAQSINDLRQKAIALSNCAYTAKYLNQFTEGLAFAKESIELSQRVGNKISESHARLEIAKIHIRLQEYANALPQLQTNLELLGNTNYTYPHTDTLIVMGQLYNQWQKPEFALPYLEQAITLSENIQSIIFLNRCHKELAQTYQLKGEFEAALEHYKIFHRLKEQILNQQTNSNLKAIELAFKIKASDQEKKLLLDKNNELEVAIKQKIEAEQEIKSYQDSLEELVEKRTEKLKRKNEELERFTYTVSHDLKSPLITIRGFIGLLERDIADNNEVKIKRNMTRIDAAAEKMLNLLENLLELSKIGHTADTLVRVPLLAIILEAKDLVTGPIKENNVTVIIENDLPNIYGDYQRLVELFQNLIENGCKFMGGQSTPTITIGASQQPDNTLLCFVRDNGIGIEPQYHSKVFNLFERLDQSTNGTGVGLALVKRIVDYHNGRIWIESEGKNKGATFYFTLQTPTFPHQDD